MKIAVRIFLLLLVAAFCAEAPAQILISNYAPAYTQNFDTLASTGTSSTVPSGWSFVEAGTGANSTYAAGNGTSTTGDTYSFGSTGSSDRALGESGGNNPSSFVGSFGARFQNNGTNPITRLSISYWGEHWRYGNNSADKLDFQISFNATSLTTGTWTDINALDFGVVNTTSNNTALDGNLTANRAFKSVTNFALLTAVNPNATFWIRWTGTNVSSHDSGLAVDDFSLAAVPEPSTYLLAGAAVLGLVYFSRRRKRRLAIASVPS